MAPFSKLWQKRALQIKKEKALQTAYFQDLFVCNMTYYPVVQKVSRPLTTKDGLAARLPCCLCTGKKDYLLVVTKSKPPLTTKDGLAARLPCWRKRRDSNPRYVAVQLISSQSRYDHFDTLPYSTGNIITYSEEKCKRKMLSF